MYVQSRTCPAVAIKILKKSSSVLAVYCSTYVVLYLSIKRINTGVLFMSSLGWRAHKFGCLSIHGLGKRFGPALDDD